MKPNVAEFPSGTTLLMGPFFIPLGNNRWRMVLTAGWFFTWTG